jgi:molybdate transport system permease protein
MNKRGRTDSPPYSQGLRFFSTGALILLSTGIASLFLADVFYINKASIKELFISPEIMSAVYLSITASFIATVLSVAIAVPSAYALSRFAFPGRIVLDILVDLLLVIPVLVVGVSVLVLFRFTTIMVESPVGWVHGVGLACNAIGNQFIYQRAGIVLVQFICSVPFSVRVIKSTFDTIDPRTEQVAQTLGTTAFGAFFRVSLPLALKGIIAGGILTWARAFGLFGPVSLVAGAVRGKTEVLPTAIFLEISIGRIEIALAMSLLMIAIAFVILLAVRLIAGSTNMSAGGAA